MPHRILALSVAALLFGSIMARAEQIATALGAPHSSPGQVAAPADPDKMNVHLAAVNDPKPPHLSRIVVAAPATRVRRVSANTSYDVPLAAMQAYRQAAAILRKSAPRCHLHWPLLAAIGQVESDNGQYGGAQVLADGTVTPEIVGPPLNGRNGTARVPDTDNGRLDGDTRWDRAVGPMQFLPSTWAVIGVDANQDGVRDPNNFNDAALAAGTYLCAMSGDLRNPAQLRAAVFSYNHSKAYVHLVLKLAQAYANGAAHVVGDYLPPADTGVQSSNAAGPPNQHPNSASAGGSHTQVVTPHRQHGSGGPSTSPATTGGATTKPPASPPTTHPSPPGPPTTAPTSPVPTTPTTPVTTGPGGPPSTAPTTAPTTTTPTTTTPPTTQPTTTPPTTTTPAPPHLTRTAGTLATCDGAWCLKGGTLDLGARPDLSIAQGDYNGDGTTASVAQELNALIGHHVVVQTNDAGLVVTINSLPYVDHEARTGGGISPSGGMPTS